MEGWGGVERGGEWRGGGAGNKKLAKQGERFQYDTFIRLCPLKFDSQRLHDI